MKKQLKYILITLSAAIVIGLGALCVVLFVPDAPDVTSSSLVSQDVVIYDKAVADVVKMTVTNQHGSYELTPKDSGNFHIAELDPYDVVQSYLNSLASTYSKLEARKLVTETPEDLSVYGFDEPIATLKAEFKDETLTVVIGNGETTTGGYYCKLENSDKVYLLSSGIGGRLLSDKTYYIDRQISPSYDTNQELLFDKVTLSGSVREKEIVIVPTDPAVDEAYAEIFAYEIISPAYAPFNLTTGNDFLTSFFVMAADSIACLSPDESDLAEYGFDNPYSVAEIKSSAGSFTITVGKVDGDYCYLKNDTDDVIFRCLKTSVSWLETQYKDVVSNIFLVPHISTVQKVGIVTENKQYNYSITYDEENKVVFAKCDDKTLNSENFQSFYQVLVSCSLESYNTERAEGDPYMTLVYYYNEGSKDYIEFYKSSDPRQSLIKFNGEFTDFSVRTVYVDKIISDCERLLRGEEISTTW